MTVFSNLLPQQQADLLDYCDGLTRLKKRRAEPLESLGLIAFIEWSPWDERPTWSLTEQGYAVALPYIPAQEDRSFPLVEAMSPTRFFVCDDCLPAVVDGDDWQDLYDEDDESSREASREYILSQGTPKSSSLSAPGYAQCFCCSDDIMCPRIVNVWPSKPRPKSAPAAKPQLAEAMKP